MKLRQARKAQTREALLDSAARVFSSRGYHDAGLEDIARGAGVSTGAIYSSFAGKDDLFLTLVEREIMREFEAFAADVGSSEDLVDRLTRGARQYMAFMRREPGLFLLSMEFWGRAVRDPALGQRYAEHRARRTAAVELLVAASLDEFGASAEMTPRRIAVAMEALADGLTLRWIATPDEVPEALLSETLTFALRGLLAAS